MQKQYLKLFLLIIWFPLWAEFWHMDLFPCYSSPVLMIQWWFSPFIFLITRSLQAGSQLNSSLEGDAWQWAVSHVAYLLELCWLLVTYFNWYSKIICCVNWGTSFVSPFLCFFYSAAGQNTIQYYLLFTLIKI